MQNTIGPSSWGKVEKNSKTKLMLKNGDSKVDNEIRDYNSSEALK